MAGETVVGNVVLAMALHAILHRDGKKLGSNGFGEFGYIAMARLALESCLGDVTPVREIDMVGHMIHALPENQLVLLYELGIEALEEVRTDA